MFHTTTYYTLPRYILSITAEIHKHRQKYPVLKGTQIINPFLTLMEDFFLAVFIQELLSCKDKYLTEILQNTQFTKKKNVNISPHTSIQTSNFKHFLA